MTEPELLADLVTRVKHQKRKIMSREFCNVDGVEVGGDGTKPGELDFEEIVFSVSFL